VEPTVVSGARFIPSNISQSVGRFTVKSFDSI
jgi:hypothetical protein